MVGPVVHTAILVLPVRVGLGVGIGLWGGAQEAGNSVFNEHLIRSELRYDGACTV